MTTPLAPFIVFEGIDGAGTTTQTKLLLDALHNHEHPTIQTREPSDGPIGIMIRQMLAMRIVLQTGDGIAQPMTRETLALLFAADRLDHVAADIDPNLKKGVTVISDRYYHSSLAYQGDIEEGTGQVDYDWVTSINARARVPDLTFFLRIDVETSLARLGQRAKRDLYETREKLERLIVRYDEVIELLQKQGQPIIVLDATHPIDELHENILARVLSLYPSA